MNVVIKTWRLDRAIDAINYFDAAFRDTRVILEIRDQRLVVRAQTSTMAIGIAVGSVEARSQQIGVVGAENWSRLRDLVRLFNSGNHQLIDLQIALEEDAVLFESGDGWAYKIPSTGRSDLGKLPDKNLTAKSSMETLFHLLRMAFPGLKNDSPGAHRLQFKLDQMRRAVIQIIGGDQQVLSSRELDFLSTHARGFKINPAQFHDGLVLLNQKEPLAVNISIFEDPDMSCRMVRREDTKDYLLIANYR